MPGPPTSTSAREKAGAWPQLTIPPTAPLKPIMTASTVRPPDSSISSEIKVGPIGNRLAVTCSPRVEGRLAGIELDHRPERLDQALAPPREKVESRRLPAKASSALVSSSVVVLPRV